jgi:hypothetical protein
MVYVGSYVLGMIACGPVRLLGVLGVQGRGESARRRRSSGQEILEENSFEKNEPFRGLGPMLQKINYLNKIILN